MEYLPYYLLRATTLFWYDSSRVVSVVIFYLFTSCCQTQREGRKYSQGHIDDSYVYPIFDFNETKHLFCSQWYSFSTSEKLLSCVWEPMPTAYFNAPTTHVLRTRVHSAIDDQNGVLSTSEFSLKCVSARHLNVIDALKKVPLHFFSHLFVFDYFQYTDPPDSVGLFVICINWYI